MKRILLALMAFAALGLVGVAAVRMIDVAVANSGVTKAGAEEQTVTFVVDKMTCAMCPITVRKALEKVPGVIQAEAKYEGEGVGWAKVTFDPTKTNVQALTKATANAGYPSTLKRE